MSGAAAVPGVAGIARRGSIDDWLGPAEGRFFGSGYRQTGPTVRDVRIRHSEGTSVLESTAGLQISGDWSLKGTSAQRPHLGTTDAVALVAQAVGALLATRYAPETAAQARITRMAITASGRPVEEGLDAFGLDAELHHGADMDMEFTAAVGTMQAAGSLHRPAAVPSLAEVRASGPLVGLCGEAHVYGTLYKDRSVVLEQVQIHGGGEATAEFAVTLGEHEAAPKGLEAAQQPAASMIEAFVAALQLGQVLLYETDRLTRAESSTLWMRRTEFDMRRPIPADQRTILTVGLNNSRIVQMDGAPWRCADIVADFGESARVSCSVAHRLPTDH